MVSAERPELHPICSCCGAPCTWVFVDRVAVGSERVIFVQRQLTCEACGRFSAPAYFPWRSSTTQMSPISIVDAIALGGAADAEEP